MANPPPFALQFNGFVSRTVLQSTEHVESESCHRHASSRPSQRDELIRDLGDLVYWISCFNYIIANISF